MKAGQDKFGRFITQAEANKRNAHLLDIIKQGIQLAHDNYKKNGIKTTDGALFYALELEEIEALEEAINLLKNNAPRNAQAFHTDNFKHLPQDKE